MRFLTRELYQNMQAKSRDELIDSERRVVAEQAWSEARKRSDRAQKEILGLLPQGARSFIEKECLHDAIVQSVDYEGATLTITLKYPAARIRPEIRYTLTFHGVREAEGIDEIKGQWWLEQEIALSSKAAFELHVLCDRSEFRVIADEIEFTREDLGEWRIPPGAGMIPFSALRKGDEEG